MNLPEEYGYKITINTKDATKALLKIEKIIDRINKKLKMKINLKP